VQGTLQSLSAGYDLPKYRLNVEIRASNPRFRVAHDRTGIQLSQYEAFYIKSDHAEIRWLCDGLNEWTGFEIQHWEPPC